MSQVFLEGFVSNMSSAMPTKTPITSQASGLLNSVAVMGATGYSGKVLCQLLGSHPYFKIKKLLGREDKPADQKGQIDLVFLCTPAETSLELAPQFLEAGIHVVDLSGAFRLKSHSYPEWYGFEHTQKSWLDRAEYGLFPWKKPKCVVAGEAPRLISNPGCYATAVSMALIPMLQSGLFRKDSFVIDAKSGTSGAGKKATEKLLFSEIFGDFAPYRVGRHQHWPEIQEAVEVHSRSRFEGAFVTELLPVERGISAAIFGELEDSMNFDAKMETLIASFESAYGHEPDISFGTDERLGSMKAVVHTNRVHFLITRVMDRVVVFTALDNLLRGASGQALMNANMLAGLSPYEGLK